MSTKQFQVQWLLIMLDIKWLISELSPDILIVLFYSTPLLGSAVILILTHWGFAGRIWDFLFGVWLDLDSTGPAQFVLSKAILTLGMFTVSPSVAKNVCLFLFIAVSTATSCFFLFSPCLRTTATTPTSASLSATSETGWLRQSPCSEQVYLSLSWWVYYSEVSP